MQLNRWQFYQDILHVILPPLHLLAWILLPILVLLLDREYAWQLHVYSLGLVLVASSVWGWLIKRLHFPQYKSYFANILFVCVAIALFATSSLIGGYLSLVIYGA